MELRISCRPRTLQILIYLFFSICIIAAAVCAFYHALSDGSPWARTERLLFLIASCVLTCSVGAILAKCSDLCLNALISCVKSVKLWRLRDPSHCVICVSSYDLSQKLSENDGKNRTGVKRYGVGEGQIYALPYVISSLTEAYGENINWYNFTHANDYKSISLINRGFGDLILLGGPFTNRFTSLAFNMLSEKIKILTFNNTELHFLLGACGRKFSYEVEGDFKSPDGDVKADVGMILCCDEPTKNGTASRRIIIFAGCNTYGTGAASLFFCKKMSDEEIWKKNRKKDYIAVVKCWCSQSPPLLFKTELLGFHCLN